MDIVVHGTKGGCQIFTPNKLGGLIDVNSDASKDSAIGQEAFALRFIDKTIIFSKYKIIRDVRGAKRTGFIGFSLFLSNSKKLNGIDIVLALNKVSEEYYKRYMPENDNNLRDVKEEWGFLDRITEEYKTKLRPVSAEGIANMLSGTKFDAFIYYENDEKLQKYFDAPFQDEYNQYRQVLFVKEEFKEKPENPLNDLQHSEDNLSGKIDLENPKYKLLFNHRTNKGVRIDVKVNRVTLPSNSKIRRKDELEISWSKQFCETVTKSGKWNEISNEFIDVNSSSGVVTVKEIVLPDDIKTIGVNLQDWNGNSVYGAKIICRNAANEKPVSNNNQITFKGEDLGKSWTVAASNDRFYSGEKLIEFAKDCLGDTGNIDLVLNKHSLKKQKVTVLDKSNGDNINNFNLSKTEFTGSEIKDKHKITVSCSEFNSDSFTYCPATDIDLEPIRLNKKLYGSEPKTTHSYNVSAGENGTLKGGNSYTSYDKNGNDVRNVIVPHKGYKFTRFEKQGDTLVAQYEKKKHFYQSPNFIAGSIVGAIVIAFGIWAYFSFWGNVQPRHPIQPQPPQQTDIQKIKSYIEGNSLILDTLNIYKQTLNEAQTEVLSSLDSAIKKREFINNWNFDTLKKLHYYPAQEVFKTAIRKIDSTRYNTVKESIGDVSTLSLDKIADSIKAVLNPAKPSTEKNPDIKIGESPKDVTLPVKPEPKSQEKNGAPQIEKKQPANLEQKNEEKTVSLIAKSNHSKNITKELVGRTVTKEELQRWKEDAGMNKYKKSINLYLKFWSIINSRQKVEFDNLNNEVKNDEFLKTSELKDFLAGICSSSDAFQKYNSASGKAACKTIAELKNKVK